MKFNDMIKVEIIATGSRGNCYLLETEKNNYIFDCGKGCYPKLLQKINLEKHSLRTDLAIEAIANLKSETGIKSHLEKKEDLTITTVFLDETGSNKTGKPKGSYITIEFEYRVDRWEHKRERVDEV